MEQENKNEQDYIPGLDGVYKKSPGFSSWLFPIFLFIFIVAIIIWLYLSNSEVITQAKGKIIASRGLHLIQPRGEGKIDYVSVKEGDEVTNKEVLVQLEKQDLEIELEGILKELKLVKADIYRYESILNELDKKKAKQSKKLDLPKYILNQEKAVIKSQIELFKSELLTNYHKIEKAEKEYKKLETEISKSTKLIKLIDRKINKLIPLIHKKYITTEEYEQLVEERLNQEEDRKINRKQLELLASEIKLKREELVKFEKEFIHDINEKLLDSYQKYENLISKKEKTLETLKSKTLLSPIDGIVHNLQIYTPGTVVRSGDIIMQIIPKDSPIEVEAKVLNKDIGFISINQDVKFKVDSFPFTKYGAIPGKIKKIEKAAIKDEELGDIYPIIVHLSDNKIKVDGSWVLLIPGMSGVVDIKTGDRKMIEYILSPFLKYKDEALKER